MADTLTLLLKEFVDAFKIYILLSEKEYRELGINAFMASLNSSKALRDHLRGMMQVYENKEVRDLLIRATDLVNGIYMEFIEDLKTYPEIQYRKYHLHHMTQGGYENDEEARDLQVDDVATDLEGFIQSRKRCIDEILGNCEKLCNILYSSNIQGKEVVVGFDEEVETLLDQLTSTSINQLQVISIAGMAGLGKTTLARKLYNHPLVEYFFDIRAWTCVSQVYLVKDLLLNILSSFIHDLTDEIYKMNDTQLGEKLYRLLKGRKYLVVLDDTWDSKAWNDLKMYFPDDKTGSRFLLTSRDIDISSYVQGARPTHVLRFRNEAESWDLFLKKTFRTGRCPVPLEAFGREITRKCEGLPLAIVIASGLLKNKMSNKWWKQIAEKLSLFMVSNPSQYMDSLALSYNHLPLRLKPCFLLFGSFPEDYEVPVRKLIWLWIAQGLIHPSGSTWIKELNIVVTGTTLFKQLKNNLCVGMGLYLIETHKLS